MRRIEVPAALADAIEAGDAKLLRASALRDTLSLEDRIRSAEEQAAQITESAERRFEAAKDEGFATGVRQGSEQALDRLVEHREAIANIRDELTENATRLALDIVRDVFDIQPPEKRVAALAASAARRLNLGGKVSLRVSPALSDKVAPVFTSSEELHTDIDVVADPRLEGTAAILDTSIGKIDLDLGLQLERLHRALIPQDFETEPIDAR